MAAQEVGEVTPLEITYNNLNIAIAHVVDLAIVFSFLVFIFLGILAMQRLKCTFGLHLYNVTLAINRDSAGWEIHEKCERCNQERVEIRRYIGRI
jgi:hypothetical protein